MKTIDVEAVNIKIKKNGIIHINYNDDALLDYKMQSRIIEICNCFYNSKKRLVIYNGLKHIDISQKTGINKVSKQQLLNLGAVAIIADNIGSRLIASFYLKALKSSPLIAIFTKEEEATRWFKYLSK